MRPRSFAAALVSLPLLISGCGAVNPQALGGSASPGAITGTHYRLEQAYHLAVHVPDGDVDKVLASVVAAVGLRYGKYDRAAYLDAPGLEQFRPLEGSKAGEQQGAARAPTTSVSFSIPRDPVILQKALHAIYAAHSYEEPVI